MEICKHSNLTTVIHNTLNPSYTVADNRKEFMVALRCTHPLSSFILIEANLFQSLTPLDEEKKDIIFRDTHCRPNEVVSNATHL